MKIKRNTIMWIIAFLLSLHIVNSDSSYIEMRLVSQRNVRANSRRLGRFDSSGGSQLRDYGTSNRRRLYLESATRSGDYETVPEIDTTLQGLSKMIIGSNKLTRINSNERRQNVERISSLRRDGLSIRKKSESLSPNMQYRIVKKQLSNTEKSARGILRQNWHLTRSSDKIDRKIMNERENRLSLQVQENRLSSQVRENRLSLQARENRFRKPFSLKGSSIPNKHNTERRLPMIQTKNNASPNPQNIQTIYESEFSPASSRRFSIISRKERIILKSERRETNKKYSFQGRSDRFERVHMKERYDKVRSTRSSNSFLSSKGHYLLSKVPRLRPERDLLVSRRELKIPADRNAFRSENTRQIRMNIRSNGVGDKNIDETTLNRRNGRVFRGRLEIRNRERGQRVNRVTINVRFMNQLVKFSAQKQGNEESTTRNLQKSFVTRREIFLRQQRFSHRSRENSLSDPRINRISKRISGYDQALRRNDARDIPHISKTRNNELVSVFNQVARFPNRKINALKIGNSLSLQKRGSEESREITRQPSSKNSNRKDRSRIRNQDTIARNREIHERRVLMTNVRKPSIKDLEISKQLRSIKIFDKILAIDRSNLYGNERSHRQQERENIRDERLGRTIGSRRSFVQQRTRRLAAEQFLNRIEEITQLSRMVLKTRITRTLSRISLQMHFTDNSRVEQLNVMEKVLAHRRNTVRNQRITSDKYRYGRMDKLQSSREHNRRVRVQSNRNRNLYAEYNKNKARINTYKPSKYTSTTRNLFEYPMYLREVEHSTMLNRFRFEKRSETVRLQNRRLRLTQNIAKPVQKSADSTRNDTMAKSLDFSCYISSHLNIRGFSERMIAMKNSKSFQAIRLTTQPRKNNLHTSTPHNEVMSTLSEYLTSKKNNILSLVFNIVLGLAVVFTATDGESNKGFISRVKNQFRNCILQYTTFL